MVHIAPSILSADPIKIEDAVNLMEAAGADVIHIDIMDGHYVPNLTFGPHLVAALKKKTRLPLDVHLMVEKPHLFIPWFLEAGADWISIHQETAVHLHKDLLEIKKAKRKSGVALNPATPIHFLNGIIKELDFVLLMSVNPGRGSQSFIESSHEKIKHLKHWIKGQNLSVLIEVDGGVNLQNMESLIRDGVDVIVAGSAIFHHPHPQEVVSQMKEIALKVGSP
ncbi:MAG: ribulose-phosphate 3-epimerase [Candidatus Aminicenantales bacterium]